MAVTKKELSLFSITPPIALEYFLHLSTGMVNTYMVARYSNELVGSMGVGNQALSIFRGHF